MGSIAGGERRADERLIGALDGGIAGTRTVRDFLAKPITAKKMLVRAAAATADVRIWTGGVRKLEQRFSDGALKIFRTIARNLRIGKAYPAKVGFPTPANTKNTVKYGCVCGNFLW
jgi:hypothetical protein